MSQIVRTISYFEDDSIGSVSKSYITTTDKFYKVHVVGKIRTFPALGDKIIIPFQIVTPPPTKLGNGYVVQGSKKVVPFSELFSFQIHETTIEIIFKTRWIGSFTMDFDLYFDGIIKTKIFLPTDENLYPVEMKNELPALCIPGGGSLSYSMMIGYVSAFLNLSIDILEKCSSIGSNSGGTWFFSTFRYATCNPKIKTKELLGEILTPEQCTLTNLETTNKKNRKFLGNRVAFFADPLLLIPEYLQENIDRPQWWSYFLNKNFLRPYEIDSRPVCKDNRNAINIKKENPDYPEPLVPTTNPNLEWIAISSIILYPLVKDIGAAGVVEMGNQYSGVPLPLIENEKNVMGGYFQDTFSFGSSSPSEKLNPGENKNCIVKLTNSYQYSFNLSDIMAFSSSAYAGYVFDVNSVEIQNTNINEKELLLPKLQLWSKDVPGRSFYANIGDGEYYDSSVIIPMLSRKKKRIFSFNHSLNPLKRLFGIITSMDFKPPFANYTQVFDQTEFEKVDMEFQKNQRKYGVSFAKVTLTTLNNSKCNVSPYQVEIFFLLLEASEKFNRLLPVETQQALSTEFQNFPNYSVLFQNPPQIIQYTLKQINLLVAMTYWSIQQIEQPICDWFQTNLND